MNFKFMGYKTENMTKTEIKEKNKKLKFDAFQIAKLDFLNKVYDNENTQWNYWRLYETNIHPVEVEKKKDLIFFTESEAKSLLMSFITFKSQTRNTIRGLCRIYCQYRVDAGDVEMSPFRNINSKDLIETSPKILKNTLWGLRRFYSDCTKLETEFNVNPNNIAVILLARYGIIGDKLSAMINLKWCDIDFEKKIVKIVNETNGEIISKVPVDDNFIFWISKIKTENIKYYDYVLSGSSTKLTYSSVYGRVGLCFNKVKEIKKVALKDLLFTRQLELLLEIRKTRQLMSSDFHDIVRLFMFDNTKNINITRMYLMMKRYEQLTDDIVIKEKNKAIVKKTEIQNDNPQEVYNRIIKDLGL